MYEIKLEPFRMDDAFYLTLPSNGASEVYPSNRPTRYRTDLNLNKNLLSGWEVGLSQIQFTHNWNASTPEFKFMAWIINTGGQKSAQEYPRGYTIGALEARLLDIANAKVTATERSEAGDLSVTHARSRVVTVPASSGFRHVEEFGAFVAEYIADALDEEERHIYSVKYDRKSDNIAKFTVVEHTGDAHVYIGMSSEDDEIFEILGISPRRESSLLTNKKLKVYQFRELYTVPRRNGFANIETIFVYSDVCEEQLVGSQRAQVLKLVPVTVQKGERQCNEYPRPAYVPVVPTSLGNIEVSLCDLTGEEIQIWEPNSLVTIVLHFRKRKGHAAEGGWC